VTWYQKCKINLDFNLDFTEARDSEWQWHQLSHMQVWTALQTDNHASTLPLKFFTGRVPFLPPNNSVKALKACWVIQYQKDKLHNITNKQSYLFNSLCYHTTWVSQ